ncbi:unnamed protein product, partial [Mesorhabditis belari]|uniref:C2H2-type domain-containing protein n=1 Tax=Mesorhabditis belari TaxID=2138241 RepID=A0AAF3ECL1_9BILA
MDFFKLIADLDDQPSVSDTKPQSSGDFVASSTSTSASDKNAFDALHGVDDNTETSFNNTETSSTQNISKDSLKRKRELTPEVSTAEDESVNNNGIKQHASDKCLLKKKAKLEIVETSQVAQASTSKAHIYAGGELEENDDVKYYYQKSDDYRNLIKQTINEMPEWESPLHSLEKDRDLVAQEVAESLEALPMQKTNVKDKRCQFCSIVCASIQSLIRHIERKHPEQKDQWSQTYVQEENVASLPVACSKCNKRFATVESFRYHDKRKHAQNLPFDCTLCGKKYPIASELRKHHRRVHNRV